MEKRDDSIRSLGKVVTIAVEKPLREDIRTLAAKKGVTMVEYLRNIVLEDKKADPQTAAFGVSAPAPRPATGDQVEELGRRIFHLSKWLQSTRPEDNLMPLFTTSKDTPGLFYVSPEMEKKIEAMPRKAAEAINTKRQELAELLKLVDEQTEPNLA